MSLKAIAAPATLAECKTALDACKDERERAELKAQWYLDTVQKAAIQQQLQKRDFTFELSDGSKVHVEQVGFGVLDPRTNAVVPTPGKTSALWVRVRVNGEYPNGDGWYGFANPPVAERPALSDSDQPEFSPLAPEQRQALDEKLRPVMDSRAPELDAKFVKMLEGAIWLR